MPEVAGPGVDIGIDPALFDEVETGTEALLSEWRVAPGDAVAAGQEIGVAELVKASVGIAAPRAGRMAALCVAAGDTFGRGAVLARLLPD